jgi:fumarate reductase subunit D
MPEEKHISENHILAALSYLWLLFLIPLLTKKEDPYCQFHAKQGLVLFLFSLLIVVIGVLPVLGWLVSFFGWLFVSILSIVGFIYALMGKEWEMPVLGKYAKKIKL